MKSGSMASRRRHGETAMIGAAVQRRKGAVTERAYCDSPKKYRNRPTTISAATTAKKILIQL